MDKIQMIMATMSAIASAVAAIAALITTIQNKRAYEKTDQERHAMIKPQFVITATSEDRIKREYKFDVENIGYGIINGIVAKWEGTEKADIKLSRYIEEDKSMIYVIELKFKGESRYEKDIGGQITLTYTDILGKKYDENINIAFKNIFNDTTEMYYLVLNDTYGECFT